MPSAGVHEFLLWIGADRTTGQQSTLATSFDRCRDQDLPNQRRLKSCRICRTVF